MKVEDFYNLENEVILSTKYIQYGLKELEKLDGSEASYHLAFSLLVNGFERLMKCIICFWFFKKNATFPDVKKYGHRLIDLKKEVLGICEDMNYRKRCPASDQDMDFLEHDETLNEIILLLSKFGEKSRYYSFDSLARVEIDYDNPYEVIEEIEKKIVDRNPKLKELQFANGMYSEFIKGLNNEYRKLFRKLARAFCRLFTLGDLGKDAEKMYSHVAEFINIMNHQL